MIRRGARKLDDAAGYDEWRVCHNPPCGSRFRPSAGLSGESTEYHCGVVCAAVCLALRLANPAPLIAAREED